MAMMAAWRGDLDEAFEFIEQGMESKDGIIYAITTWPMARPLWDDPRYPEVLGRMGLEVPVREVDVEVKLHLP